MTAALRHHGGSFPFTGSSPAFVRSKTKRRADRMQLLAQVDEAALAEAWGRFIRENFTAEQQVMRAFGCSRRTAVHWFNGDHPPRGGVIYRAVIKHGFLVEDAA